MKVEGLTRHNVASHLQKSRMNKRQILPKEEDQKWLNQRDPVQMSYCLKRPIMAFPPYHSNHTLSPAPVYPIWGQSGSQMFGMQIWGPPGYPLWQPTESWHWKPFPAMHADAWGCPVLPPPQARCFSYSQNMHVFHNANAVDYKFCMPQSSFEHYLGHFLIKNSKYLVPAQDLLKEFCSLGIKQSDVVKQKSQKNKQWEEDNGSGPSKKHSLTSLEFVELQKRKTKLLSMLEEVDMFPNQSYMFRFI